MCDWQGGPSELHNNIPSALGVPETVPKSALDVLLRKVKLAEDEEIAVQRVQFEGWWKGQENNTVLAYALNTRESIEAANAIAWAAWLGSRRKERVNHAR